MEPQRAVLIMAGGRGTRLWPWSRRARPKQLLALTGTSSLLEETVARASAFAPRERIFLIADESVAASARSLLPDIPERNVIVEPAGRNTWPCCVLGTAYVMNAVGNDAVVAVLPADHAVGDARAFTAALITAAARADAGVLVTFGIRPARPETGYGYVKCGEVVDAGPPVVRRGVSFQEKPSAAKAREYISSGDYLWNGGMFIWRGDAFLQAANELRPQERATTEALIAAVRSGDAAAVTELHGRLEETSVDYALMEKLPAFEVVVADCGWDDVGSFDALERIMPLDAEGNVLMGDVTAMGARGNVVVGEGGRPIVITGVDNVVVVDAGDVVVVYPKGKAESIREVVALIKKEHPELL